MYVCMYICIYIYIYICIYICIYTYIKIIQGDIFFKISDISNLTNLQQTVTNKKCKKLYTK